MFLHNLLNNKFLIIDVNDVHCPSLKQIPKSLNVKCSQHHEVDFNYQCALKNVYSLKSWICENSCDE